MSSRLAVVKQFARVGLGYLHDVATSPTVLTLDQVPASPRSLTPEWLTAALCKDKDANVESFRVEPISDGSTCRSRLFVEYSGAEAADLPSVLFLKTTATFKTRIVTGATGGASGEVRWYRQIQPTTPIVAPVGYHGAVDRRVGRSILLLEDLVHTRGATFGDVRDYTDRAAAQALVDSLAVVHGCLEDSHRFDEDLRWLITSHDLQQNLNTYVDSEGTAAAGLDKAGDAVPTALRARRDELHRYRMRSFELDAQNPRCLVHQDVHAGNWFRTADGQMGLYDWSAFSKGQGTRDVAYALMSTLTTEDRRDWERDLLDRYADRISHVTGTAHDPEHLWRTYRQQTLHGLCFWLSTLGSSRWQPKMQTDETSMINIARMAQAVVDLQTLDELDR